VARRGRRTRGTAAAHCWPSACPWARWCSYSARARAKTRNTCWFFVIDPSLCAICSCCSGPTQDTISENCRDIKKITSARHRNSSEGTGCGVVSLASAACPLSAPDPGQRPIYVVLLPCEQAQGRKMRWRGGEKKRKSNYVCMHACINVLFLALAERLIHMNHK
jgi:hypothetical protein